MVRTVGNGRFELGAVAGRGGMGTVYRAVDRQTEQLVAVKLMSGANASLRLRFRREGEVLGRLVDAHIVRYVAHGEVSSEELFLAMEWLEGEDLAVRLQRGPLSIDETVTVARAVAAGLGVAHAHGIVHRDIKPSNLFLVEGRIEALKLLDFGVARLHGATVQATRIGQPIGTPSYMSPEQARGDLDIDARSDLFALGCVLYECLGGTPPFEAESLVATLARILFSPCEPITQLRSDTPPRLAALVAALLEKERDRRPLSAALTLERLREEGASSAPPRGVTAAPHIGATERRRLFIVVARNAAVSSEDETLAALEDPAVAATATPATPIPARLSAVASAHDAVIERLVDGSVVAVLSARAAASDAARQAARMALALRGALGEVPLSLATGTAVSGAGLPWGAVIDRAVALCTAGDARCGIRIDDAVMGLLDGRFELREDEAGALLVGEEERTTARRRLLGRPSPCVGREREIGTIMGTLTESAHDCVARVVIVLALPGVGKSRLLGELLERGPSSVEDLQIWSATADPLRAGSPFGMVANLVRTMAGVRAGGDPAEQRAQLRARLRETMDGDALERVHVFLSEMLGIAGDDGAAMLVAARRDPRLLGDRMREAFVELVDAHTRSHPLIIALDDLHWGDLPSVKCLDDCVRRLANRPLLLVALARPEIRAVFDDLWSAHEPLVLPLHELSAKPRERLVRAMLGSKATDEIVARVSALSGGNAFYLEELIRAVASDRSELPESVLAMAQVRYEGLAPEVRAVLRAASIFGMVSWAGAIAHLLGREASEVGALLRGAVTDELLQAQPESRFAAHPQFEFRHALLREAAYAALTDADREVGHRLAGEWLCAAGEVDAMVLAEHFERGRRLEEAIRWYCRAAQQSLEGGDFQAARARVHRGIECGATGDELGQMLVADVNAVRWQGQYELLRSIATSYRDRVVRGSRAWLELVGCTAVVTELSEPLRAFATIEPAPSDRPVYLIAAARLLTQWAIRGVDIKTPTWLIDRITSESQSESDDSVAGWLFEARAFTAATEDRYQDTLDLLVLSEAAFARAGDRRNALAQQVNLGFAYLEVAAFDQAEEVATRAAAEAVELGLEALVNLAKSVEMCARAWRARDYEALAAIGLAEIAAGSSRLEPMAQAALAYTLAGDLDAAERMLAEILSGATNGRFILDGRLDAMLAAARGAFAPAIEQLARVSRRSLGLGTLLGFSAAIDDLTRVVAHDGLGDEAGARRELEIARARVDKVARALREPMRAAYLDRFDVVRLRVYADKYCLAFPG